MKKITYYFTLIMAFSLIFSCQDEVSEIKQEGNPILEVKSPFSNVHFGDLLPFEVEVSDTKPLSVLNVNLYFGEEVVSKTTIRTKENGNYIGAIKVPFLKNIPDGTATLEFTLNNITLKKTNVSVDVPIKRAQYPYLLLVTNNDVYPMLPTNNSNEYSVTEAFPSTDLPAYIKTPVLDDKGNEIFFGWESGAITQDVKENIPFVSPVGGEFSVTFNTLTYFATPFFEIVVKGQKMDMLDKETYFIDLDLKQGEYITIDGIEDISTWWIDSDFFNKNSDNEFIFVPIDGKYRITADLKLKYFRIEVLDGSTPAVLNEDGTGAIWIIGDKVGKPSVADRNVNWDTSKAICMAPIGSKQYQLTVVGGKSVEVDYINFKFFHQNDWGGEFSSSTLSTDSDIIFVGDDKNGRDDGNLGIAEGKELEEGATYVFVVDVSAGIDKGVLTVTKK